MKCLPQRYLDRACLKEKRLVIPLMFAGFLCSAWGSATQWKLEDGGNGHFYEVISSGSVIDWDQARRDAKARGGDLASITSDEENAFVFGLVDDPAFWTFTGVHNYGPWIGAVQANKDSEPAGGWAWTDGSPWVSTPWASGQPDNHGGIEDHAHYFVPANTRTATWNDWTGGGLLIRAYVLEKIVSPGVADIEPILRYTFEDGSDPTSNSGTLGAEQDGNLTGNALFATFDHAQAVELDGSNANSVIIPQGPTSAFNIGDNDFSIFARFKTDFADESASRLRGLVWKQSLGPGPDYSLGVRQENGLAQFGMADGSNSVFILSTAALNDGLTHELLAVRQGNFIGLYVDGLLDATAIIPDDFGSTSNAEALVIGGRTLDDADDWTGLIDEVTIWSAALTTLEPSVKVTLLPENLIRVDFTGRLEESETLEVWRVLDPQPSCPLIFEVTDTPLFFRARN